MRGITGCFTAILMVVFLALQAQQKHAAPAKIKSIAILPVITNIDKKALRADIDSASWAQIQEKEALNGQSKNYYLLAQKKPNYNVVFQPINQTNSLLQQAGITYHLLAEIPRSELADLLEVDMIFYGVNNRIADPNTPEGRLAINIGVSLLLPPLAGSFARNTDKPITTLHYLLYDRASNKAIWHYKDETTRPGTYYLEKFRNYLMAVFPKTR